MTEDCHFPWNELGSGRAGRRATNCVLLGPEWDSEKRCWELKRNHSRLLRLCDGIEEIETSSYGLPDVARRSSRNSC